MKKQAMLLLALAMVPVFAGSLSQGERDYALSNLHAGRKAFLDSIAGLSEAQWKFKPAPDRWSIAECAEHITASEDFLFGLITDKVMKTAAAAPATPPTREQDEAVIKMVTDRSKRFKAPAELQPSGRWPTSGALAEAFRQSRDRIISFVRETQADLRAHSQDNRDAYQWVLFLSAHSDRHVEQINEVKADANFPKK